MAESVFAAVEAQPGVLVDDLTKKFIYVLQPVALYELLQFTEQVGATTIRTKHVARMTKPSPFAGLFQNFSDIFYYFMIITCFCFKITLLYLLLYIFYIHITYYTLYFYFLLYFFNNFFPIRRLWPHRSRSLCGPDAHRLRAAGPLLPAAGGHWKRKRRTRLLFRTINPLLLHLHKFRDTKFFNLSLLFFVLLSNFMKQ